MNLGTACTRGDQALLSWTISSYSKVWFLIHANKLQPTDDNEERVVVLKATGDKSTELKVTWIALVGMALLIFSILLYQFAVAQDVWIDETTQLSGITLKFVEMFRWLTGEHVDRFGIPGDRMPPATYVLDWVWLRVFGSSELSFRLFHAAFLVAGTALIVVTASRRLNATASFIALAMLVLSPRLIQAGVEIRAYPIFFACSCAQTVVFLSILDEREKINRKLLVSFSAVSVFAIYVHFFGLVSTSSFFVALGLANIRSPSAIIELVVCYVCILLLSLGILPFALSAVTLSDSQVGTSIAGSHSYVIYILKLFGDSANLVSKPAAVLFFGGIVALFLQSAAGAIRRAKGRNPSSVDWLLVVVLAGVSITLIASRLVHSFDALKTDYGIWLVPPLMLFTASGATIRSPLFFNSYRAAFAATVLGAGFATYIFAANASEFIHGPGKFVGSAADRTKSPKAILYEAGAQWEWSYFPLVFSHKGGLAQYRATKSGDKLVLLDDPSKASPQAISDALNSYKSLTLVDVRLRTYEDLRKCRVNDCPSFQSGPVVAALVSSGRWRQTALDRQFGLYDTQVRIFDRID